MENITEPTVQDLFQVHENNFCFECGSNHNQWASLNNGILLCSRCASIHKGFGHDISLIKSITQGTWSPVELEIMKKGGNDNLQECFEKYNVPMKGPLEYKYKTKASYYYREKLKALSAGTCLPIPPSVEEGAEIMDTKNVPVPHVRRKSRNMSFSRQLTSASCEPKRENKLKEVDTNAKADTNSNLESNKKMKTQKLKTDTKEGLQSFRQSIAKFSEKMKESKKRKQEAKAQQENIPPNTQEIPDVPKKSGLKSKGILSGGLEGAKKSYRGAVGFIKRLATKKKNQRSDFERVCNGSDIEDRTVTEGSVTGDYLDL